MNVRAKLRSLAVDFPEVVRTNDFFRQRHPEVVASIAERALGKVWNVETREGRPLGAFEHEMLPYLADPFRGTVERRVLADDAHPMSMSVPAAERALAAAGLSGGDVDLLMSCTFPSGQTGIGESAFLARALGAKGAAWNLESACSSAAVGLDVGASLVAAGRHARALVISSCIYSRVTAPDDTLSWTSGDGACAFVVSADGPGADVLGAHVVHTAETCDALRYELIDTATGPTMRMKTGRGAADSLRDVAERTLDECCRAAADASGVSLSDVALFACNTPTAWFAAFVSRKLGVDRARVVDTYPRYANVGPVLWPSALHVAAHEGRLRPGDLVMAYSIGSVASAAAVVLRWGEVGLGPLPAPPRVRL
jgi:3-oxoacyl-[acyl-carrier-protein] synthase-3